MPTLTFHGHSCFQIDGGGHSLLIDPFLTGNPRATVSADEVTCDFILITHAHGDHWGDTADIARRTGATVVSNFEIAGVAEKEGLTAHPMHIGGAASFPFGRVKLTIAHHGSSFPDGSYGGNPAGLLIDIDGARIHHAGDTALTLDMKLLAPASIDLAILPIGDNFTMGIEDAVTAATFIEAKRVVPCHYGTWPPIDVDAGEFASRCADAGVPCEVMAPGDTVTL